MGYNIDWIFLRLRNPSKFWHIASTVTIAAVGFFSKFITGTYKKKRKFFMMVMRVKN